MENRGRLSTTFRDVLAVLFSEKVGDLQRRHSEGGYVIRISSYNLSKKLDGPSLGVHRRSVGEPELPEPAQVDKRAKADSALQKDRFWVLCNVMCLGVAFMMLSTSFVGTVDLQSSMNSSGGLGTISLTSMYVISVISNLCLPTFLIRWLGCKRTVAICFLAYIPFITAQLDGSSYTLIPGAVLIGVALGPIHCAAATYLQLLARTLPSSRATFETVLVRLLSIFYVFVSLSQVWGSGITALVLADDSKMATPNASIDKALERSCGANFCPGSTAAITVDPYLKKPSRERIQIVIKIYLLCAVVAFLIVILGVSSLDRYKDALESENSGFALLTSTVRLMKKRNQLLVIPITIWGGMHKAFIEEEFTQAYVSCAWSIGNIGTVMICYGLATAAASLLVGFVGRAAVRMVAVCFATLLQVGLVVLLLNWRRETSYLYMYTVVAALWAIVDSVWIVHLNTLCSRLFPGQEEAAFSNYQLWDAVGFILVSSYSSAVCMRVKLYLQLASVLLGSVCYVIMEAAYLRDSRRNTFKISG